MPLAITPGQELTFTLTAAPRRAAERKTLERLMRMESSVRHGLQKLARRRRQHDNKGHQRGGRLWWVRPHATRLVYPAPGATFTLFVTPQIAADLASVEKYLKKATKRRSD
jgi:hypothetical protein